MAPKAELKYFASSTSIVPVSGTNIPGVFYPMFGIPQGAGSASRIGRKIRVQRVRVTLVHIATALPVLVSSAVAYVHDNDSTAGDVFPPLGTGVAYLQPYNCKRIIHESVSTTGKIDGGTTSTTAALTISDRTTHEILFNAAGTAVSGLDLAVAVLWETSGNASVLKFECWFTDA